MKILVFARSTVLHDNSGGMELALQSLASNLKSRGVHLGLVTTVGYRRGASDQPFDYVWEVPGSRSGKYSFAWWRKTYKHESVRSWNPDLIVSISTAGTASVIGNSNFKHVAQCHGTALSEVKSSLNTRTLREIAKIPLNLLRIPREIYAYNRFTAVISISDEVERQLRTKPYSVSSDRLVTISNGVDLNAFSPDIACRRSMRQQLGFADNLSVGVTLGRLHRQKGVDLAIRALAESPSRRRLLVIGEGPDAEALMDLTRQLEVEDQVSFFGSVPRQRVSTLLRSADVLLFPTRRSEGLPLALIESMAAGLSVITTVSCNVPSDLAHLVATCKLDPSEISKQWETTGGNRAPVQSNQLPIRYTRTYMDDAYARLLVPERT